MLLYLKVLNNQDFRDELLNGARIHNYQNRHYGTPFGRGRG